MFGYYLDLALRSFRHTRALTTLMVVMLGLGIGACITTLTVLKLLSGNPLPDKSAQLFHPQIDPRTDDKYVPGETKPPHLMMYRDVQNLLATHKAKRQAAIALTKVKVSPPRDADHPFFEGGVMTTVDFFTMFEMRFRFGSGWSQDDQAGRARVVVIASFLNDRLFGGANSVGRILRINDQDFRVVGVLDHWAPNPRFYALDTGGRHYGGEGDGIYLPLEAARGTGLQPVSMSCIESVKSDLESAPCMWLSFWVEIPDAAGQSAYRSFLLNYVQQQIEIGRFKRSGTALPDLMQWLHDEKVVPDDVRLQVGLAFGFLLICIINTVGLLLAKCLRRSREVGVRRALGAPRSAVFFQFMVEAGMVGIFGGLFGLLSAEVGLWCIRQQPAQYADMAHLDLTMFTITFLLALVASIFAGLVPAWRACNLQPAPQIRSA
jgi:putative ABC transport system permease protein